LQKQLPNGKNKNHFATLRSPKILAYIRLWDFPGHLYALKPIAYEAC